MLFKRSFKFPYMFNTTTGETSLDSEFTSINRCLALICTTARGELFGDPEFGCTLYEHLFELDTPSVIDLIVSDIVNSIDKYEKRVTVTKNNISIEQDSTHLNLFKITIAYTIKNSNEQNSVTFEFNKEDYHNYE